MTSPRELVTKIARDSGWVSESEHRTDTFTRADRRIIVEWSPWRLNTGIDIEGERYAHQAADMVAIDGKSYPFMNVQALPAILREA